MDIKNRKQNNLRGKRVLITAGPTWAPIDNVRVISNIATGETGMLLAEKLSAAGARVTLLLGPGCGYITQKKIRIIRFKFFDELRQTLRRLLAVSPYDSIIHSAAVSDFRPKTLLQGKLKSGKSYNLKLAPLPKIADEIRRLAPWAKLVLFKLESGVSDKELIKRSRSALRASGADLIVANRIEPSYKAYILDRDKIYARSNSKEELVDKLTEAIRSETSDSLGCNSQL